MKTEIKLPEATKKIWFPLIAIAKDDNSVVLFTERCKGVVLVKGNNENADKVGIWSDIFISCFDKDCWNIPSEVQITFKNE